MEENKNTTRGMQELSEGKGYFDPPLTMILALPIKSVLTPPLKSTMSIHRF